jgi:hypothetical protein
LARHAFAGFRRADGFALVFDDTGRFDISADGSVITWHRPAGGFGWRGGGGHNESGARAGVARRRRVLAPRSAVSLNGSGLAFVAPKLHGKSTLCSALVIAGARALSDDTVPIRPGAEPRLSPGLPRLKLWTDAAARLFGVEADGTTVRKHLMDHLDAGQIERRTVPFKAAYVLNPVMELPDGSAVNRERLDSVAATMALVMHAKLGPVLTGVESPVVLSRAADVARSVPVYALHVVRNLERVNDVARQLFAWHAGEQVETRRRPVDSDA